MAYEQYLKAERLINEGLIRRNLSIEREGKPPRDPLEKMAAMRAFLVDCDHPESGIPAIHVGGTSGKGSVSAAIAGILHRDGLKVGLHISPYLQAATEKIWIDGRFVSGAQFAELVDWIMPLAERRLNAETPASIHGMASIIIALEAFRREAVDVMVFEVGCGGRYDLSNVLDTEVAVVTNIGLDHLVSLGPDIEQIAWHKAGIAKRGVPLVTGAEGTSLAVIEREARSVGAPLTKISGVGDAFLHNREMAIAAARLFAERTGRILTDRAISEGPTVVRMAGRSEVMPVDSPLVILDGAHNAEKLKVAVGAALAKARTGRRVCLFGAIGAKAGPDLVRPLHGRFDHIVATEPRVYAKSSNPAAQTAALFANETCSVETIAEPSAALDRAIELAGDDGTVLVTGSFYLLSSVRERYYPKAEVVNQRSSFPTRVLEK